MNGWDLFTWLNCAVLAGAAITIFGFFLKDAKGIISGDRSDDGQVDVLQDMDPQSLESALSRAVDVQTGLDGSRSISDVG